MRRSFASFLFIGIAQFGAMIIPQTVFAEVAFNISKFKSTEKSCVNLLRSNGIRPGIAPSICKEYLATQVVPRNRYIHTSSGKSKWVLQVPADKYYQTRFWRNRVNAKVRLSDEEFSAAVDTIHDQMLPRYFAVKSTPSLNVRATPSPAAKGISRPSRSVAQTSDPIHEKCLQARDYQGCVDSFSGRRSYSNSSDYERRMLELKRQELMEQRRYAREQEERDYARAERERRQRAAQLIQKGFDDIEDAFRPDIDAFKGPDRLLCNTTNFGSFDTINCF